MTREIIGKRTPEEIELEQKRIELDVLETELAERELDLTTFEAELQAFERRYLRTVGVRYAELDKIEAEIANWLAESNPYDEAARERAHNAGAQAKESERAAGDAQSSKERDDFVPGEEIKKLYRQIAKLVHPDLATTEVERARRTELMAEANQAYQKGDATRLEAILDEWDSSPESVKGEDTGAELVRIIRKLAQLRNRIAAVEERIAGLKGADLFKLMSRVHEAQETGRDLLKEMAARLDDEIANARKRLANLAHGAGLA